MKTIYESLFQEGLFQDIEKATDTDLVAQAAEELINQSNTWRGDVEVLDFDPDTGQLWIRATEFFLQPDNKVLTQLARMGVKGISIQSPKNWMVCRLTYPCPIHRWELEGTGNCKIYMDVPSRINVLDLDGWVLAAPLIVIGRDKKGLEYKMKNTIIRTPAFEKEKWTSQLALKAVSKLQVDSSCRWEDVRILQLGGCQGEMSQAAVDLGMVDPLWVNNWSPKNHPSGSTAPVLPTLGIPSSVASDLEVIYAFDNSVKNKNTWVLAKRGSLRWRSIVSWLHPVRVEFKGPWTGLWTIRRTNTDLLY